MGKNSFLWSIMTMFRAEDTEEGEREFFYAFNVFEKKFERGTFFILAILGGTFLISAFRFISALDFFARLIIGGFFVFFSAWSIKQKK